MFSRVNTGPGFGQGLTPCPEMPRIWAVVCSKVSLDGEDSCCAFFVDLPRWMFGESLVLMSGWFSMPTSSLQSIAADIEQGSLHYTPEHCLVKKKKKMVEKAMLQVIAKCIF